ncbi:HAD domain-containing protein [Planobispora longispora]|uniref:Secreted protein n=1 Tax=Planobispora longispora TaxID=28887 RepID=A0A8J3RDE8_9ACTN|nr:HAD domain-containing protein [Planobispora longispora]GIH74111.1 hypothetical protein Plo01_05400 [Planobispora longispora]
MHSVRPFLLLDVDGPLNPYAAKPERRPAGYTTHRMRPEGWDDPRLRPLRVWLNPDHGPALLALPYDLVWATTWRHEANAWIAPRLGLPPLPVVDWPELHSAARDDGVHWKTRRLVEWAAGRAFAWVDDEIGDADRAFVAAHRSGPALLHRVDPRIGLLPGDFAALAAWARRAPG